MKQHDTKTVTSGDRTQAKPFLRGAKLVENPELIKVRTINPKIAEQLSYLDDRAQNTLEYDTVYAEIATSKIVGAFTKYHEVILEQSGQVYRVRAMAYVMYLEAKQGMTNAEAWAQVKSLPQIFTA